MVEWNSWKSMGTFWLWLRLHRMLSSVSYPIWPWQKKKQSWSLGFHKLLGLKTREVKWTQRLYCWKNFHKINHKKQTKTLNMRIKNWNNGKLELKLDHKKTNLELRTRHLDRNTGQGAIKIKQETGMETRTWQGATTDRRDTGDEWTQKHGWLNKKRGTQERPREGDRD